MHGEQSPTSEGSHPSHRDTRGNQPLKVLQPNSQSAPTLSSASLRPIVSPNSTTRPRPQRARLTWSDPEATLFEEVARPAIVPTLLAHRVRHLGAFSVPTLGQRSIAVAKDESNAFCESDVDGILRRATRVVATMDRTRPQ